MQWEHHIQLPYPVSGAAGGAASPTPSPVWLEGWPPLPRLRCGWRGGLPYPSPVQLEGWPGAAALAGGRRSGSLLLPELS